MRAGRGRRIVWVALGTVVLLWFSAAVALAALPQGPPIVVGSADYVAGTVHVSVEASTGLSAVHFEDGNGATLGVVTSPTGPTADFDVALHADMTVVAVGYSGSDPVWSSSVPLALANYVPGCPSLALASNALVGPKLGAAGQAPGGTATTMTLFVRGGVAWSGPVAVVGGNFALPAVSMPYGVSYVSVRSINAFGQSTSDSVRVYNLGSTVKDARFILVDKSELLLYYVTGRRVTHVWPVAIGTPATPTHTGIFKLGGWRRTPNAVWGTRRMPLMKKVHKKWRGTGYYIHGTNDPSSIGTMASHGCVRMYNRDAVALSKISRGFTVQIRR